MGNWLINLSQIWASYGLKGNHRKSGDIGISMEAGSLWWTKSGGLGIFFVCCMKSISKVYIIGNDLYKVIKQKGNTTRT